jgi:hypothetical protein
VNPKTASVIRWAAVLLAGFLASNGYLHGDKDAFVGNAMEVAGGVAAAVALWHSLRDKARTGETIRAALALPQHSTPHDLKSAPTLGGFGDILTRQAISTVFAVVRDRVGSGRFANTLIQLRDVLNEAFPPVE